MRGLERYTVAYYVHAMATKRSASTAASTSQELAKKAKRQVSVLTYKKWETMSRSIRRFFGCGVMSTNVINHSLDCCGVLSIGDSRREYVESRTSRTSGLPDRATIAMS